MYKKNSITILAWELTKAPKDEHSKKMGFGKWGSLIFQCFILSRKRRDVDFLELIEISSFTRIQITTIYSIEFLTIPFYAQGSELRFWRKWYKRQKFMEYMRCFHFQSISKKCDRMYTYHFEKNWYVAF